MLEDELGNIDYDERGSGPTVVLVPGSCSTGAAWRSVIAAWNGTYRTVTTSLLGYGGTAERRTRADPSIVPEAEAMEAVIRRAGTAVHLVGHSFGGLVALVVALRRKVPLTSLTILEAPAKELLRSCGEHLHYRAFQDMNEAYFAAYEAGDRTAIERMIEFYGGPGTFAGWPDRVRAYAMETTAVNILDWACAGRLPLSPSQLQSVGIPTLVAWGGASHPAAQRANELLARYLPGPAPEIIDGAAHFMIQTHAAETAAILARHLNGP
jgi:pimeloyl-ACP methyl ester carboxylesterase